MFDMTDEFMDTAVRLYTFTPIHHFAQVTAGNLDMSYEALNIVHDVNGFLDTRYSLSYLFSCYGKSVLYLITLPILFLIGSYTAFMRKDI